MVFKLYILFISVIIFFIAAKLGEVCYSDTHCALSDEKNKCQFTIPGVFGFCVCDPTIQADCPLNGQNSTLFSKPNNTLFKYPFSKPDLKKKLPYQRRPVLQTVDQLQHTTSTTTTTTTTTFKPPRPFTDRPQLPLNKRPILKTNLTNNGTKTILAVPVTITQLPIVLLDSTPVSLTSKSPISSLPTPSPIKFYLKSPLKDSQNKSQTLENLITPIKVIKKPINGSTAGESIIYIDIYILNVCI